MISLSKRYGIPVQKIWDHPDNSPLRDRRRKTSILYPGDRVTIPEKEPREESCQTEQRHRFCCHGRTCRLNVQFLKEDAPRANEPYRLMVDGQQSEGTLDGEGWFRVTVPADAREAIIRVGEEPRIDEYRLRIGHLDPIEEIRGVQQRLNNLGFYCGQEEGNVGPKTRFAIAAFQRRYDLEVTEEVDEATRQRLQEVYGT